MPYSGDPSQSPLDAVRFWMQDTREPELLNDAEIEFMITQQLPLNGADPLIVAAFACETVASKYAGEVAISADGVTYSGDQLQQKYQVLAKSLRDRYDYLRGLSGAPYSGGVLLGDTGSTGTKPKSFAIGMDDNLRAGSQQGSGRRELEGWDDPADAL